MKVFNREISDCEECKFYDKNQGFCFYKNRIRILERFESIYENCPFNKPITKEDIESFGWKIRNKQKNKYYCTKDYEETFNLDVNKDNIEIYIEEDNRGGIFKYIIFKGKITSKPHLEFILQTLNIIK